MYLLVRCGEYRTHQIIRTLSGEEGDGSTHGTGTTSTANTMDVVLRVVGVVVVEDVSNVADIFDELLAFHKVCGRDTGWRLCRSRNLGGGG